MADDKVMELELIGVSSKDDMGGRFVLYWDRDSETWHDFVSWYQRDGEMFHGDYMQCSRGDAMQQFRERVTANGLIPSGVVRTPEGEEIG